jgi:hypothetical protein
MIEPPFGRPVRIRCGALRQIGGDGLSDNDGACIAGPGDGGGVGFGSPPLPNGRALPTGQIGGVENVLDADGNTLQRPRTGVGSLLAGIIRIEGGKGPDGWFPLRYPPQAGFHKIFRTELAVMDQPDGLPGCQAVRLQRSLELTMCDIPVRTAACRHDQTMGSLV